MAFKIVIPARYASTRLPAKPLADIAGKPMIVRVVEQVQGAGADEVWVATDHMAVHHAVEAAGFNVMMTRADHPSGTDRIAEVAAARGWNPDTIVVNVQGDEPLIDRDLVSGVACALADDAAAAVATAAHAIADVREFFNPNVVKVVCASDGTALYFSRAPIPYARDAFAVARDALPAHMPALRHIGLYAYRAGFLATYAGLAPSPLERFEALEQLRILAHGLRIRVVLAAAAPQAGVDTPEDLDRVRAAFDHGSVVG